MVSVLRVTDVHTLAQLHLGLLRSFYCEVLTHRRPLNLGARERFVKSERVTLLHANLYFTSKVHYWKIFFLDDKCSILCIARCTVQSTGITRAGKITHKKPDTGGMQ